MDSNTHWKADIEFLLILLWLTIQTRREATSMKTRQNKRFEIKFGTKQNNKSENPNRLFTSYGSRIELGLDREILQQYIGCDNHGRLSVGTSILIMRENIISLSGSNR